MRDRTKELGNAECSDEDNEGKALMVRPGTATAKEEKENNPFLKKALEIREAMESLKRKVSDLENKQKTILGEPLPEEKMKRDLQTLREEIKTMASQIHKKLKAIEPKKGEEDDKYVDVKLRMQRTLHGVLSREFVELMGHCNTVQAQYRDRNVERIQRQLRITGNDVSADRLDEMLESGQTDILKLEKSIRDLHDMFQYLAMEVEAQGEMVNRVEANILQSSDYVEKAKADVEQAATYQQKARKKKIWIALCVAILILILVISLAASFG
ncbi:hypothetical protein CRUP_023277 [Coryphaenoides rupestris]|nr:hypothetical protein CRUP_023277 [Coryphaenoides rupestris]